MHHPVLLDEVIAHLKVKKGGLYIDATYGEGGHSKEIEKRGGKVLAIDVDPQSETVIKGNFADIEKIAREHHFFPVDGIVFDLGLSMRQIAESGKGFSFKNEHEPLDMRLDPDEELTAADYIQTLSVQNLYELFAKNSEEINSRTVADAIVRSRSIRKIKTVGDLVRVIDRAVTQRDERILRRIFQALRIEVNHEFDSLKKGLEGAKRLLKPDGKILVLTFHSLEDRLVKRFGGKKITISKRRFSFERSAKLRIIMVSEVEP